MNILFLIKHYFLYNLRIQKEMFLAKGISIVLFTSYISFVCLVINSFFPTEKVWYSLVLVYGLIDLLIKLMLGNVRVQKIEPYLLLPIKNRTISIFLIGKLLLNKGNLVALGFLPIFGSSLCSFCIFILTLAFNSLNVYYIHFLLRRKLFKLLNIITTISIYTGFLLLDRGFLYLPIMLKVNYLHLSVLWALTSFLFIGVAYLPLNFQLFFSRTDTNLASGKHKIKNDLYLFLIQIIRNQRLRQLLVVSLIVLIICAPLNVDSPDLNKTIISVYGFSILNISFGQFLYSWDSCYNGWIFTKVKTKKYMWQKFIILSLFTLVSFLIYVSVQLYLGANFLHALKLFILNIFIINPLIVALAAFNIKNIKISRPAFLNYEGGSFIGFFISVLPLVNLILIINCNLIELGLVCIIVLVVLLLINKPIVRLFNKSKYSFYKLFR